MSLEEHAMSATADLMTPRVFRVRRKIRELRDVFTLVLEPSGPTEFSFAAGQFNMLYVFGVGEVPISLSGDPGQTQILVHTIRSVGAVTRAINKLKRGDAVGVRGPFGSQWPFEKAFGRDVIIVTGGLGIAPLRPAVHQLLAQRESFGKVSLLYGARTPNDILFQKEIERWRGRLDLEVEATVDSAPPGWRGNVGVVTTLIPRAQFDPATVIAFVCGPEVMMRFSVLELEKCGVSKERIFISMERNMKCAIGFCGHCQFGAAFLCKDGPIIALDRVQTWFGKREI